MFDNLDVVFETVRGGKRAQSARDRELSRRDERTGGLAAKLARKDEVIADISEIHLQSKKGIGEI